MATGDLYICAEEPTFALFYYYFNYYHYHYYYHYCYSFATRRHHYHRSATGQTGGGGVSRPLQQPEILNLPYLELPPRRRETEQDNNNI